MKHSAAQRRAIFAKLGSENRAARANRAQRTAVSIAVARDALRPLRRVLTGRGGGDVEALTRGRTRVVNSIGSWMKPEAFYRGLEDPGSNLRRQIATVIRKYRRNESKNTNPGPIGWSRGKSILGGFQKKNTLKLDKKRGAKFDRIRLTHGKSHVKTPLRAYTTISLGAGNVI